MPKTFQWVDAQAILILQGISLAEFGGASGVRDQSLFESALARPQNLQAYNPHADVADLAACYGYGLAKNHAFVDGNKRVAFAAVGLFLKINGYNLIAEKVDAYNTIMRLAAGDISEEKFAAWIRANIQAR
jgi:death-on-curing protein